MESKSTLLSAQRPGHEGGDPGNNLKAKEIETEFARRTSEWGGTPKLLLYAHGGLNNEQASASRIASMRPYFLANRIYPLHFMWETGFGETLNGILQDAFRRGPLRNWREETRPWR